MSVPLFSTQFLSNRGKLAFDIAVPSMSSFVFNISKEQIAAVLGVRFVLWGVFQWYMTKENMNRFAPGAVDNGSDFAMNWPRSTCDPADDREQKRIRIALQLVGLVEKFGIDSTVATRTQWIRIGFTAVTKATTRRAAGKSEFAQHLAQFLAVLAEEAGGLFNRAGINSTQRISVVGKDRNNQNTIKYAWDYNSKFYKPESSQHKETAYKPRSRNEHEKRRNSQRREKKPKKRKNQRQEKPNEETTTKQMKKRGLRWNLW